jgi:hypothetical protein
MPVRALFLTVVFLLALVAPAGASTITYVCGQDLCAAGPHGEGVHPITTDGAASGGYGNPSASADGRTLAFLHGGKLMVGDGQAGNAHEIALHNAPIAVTLGLRPDGQRVTWQEFFQEYDPFAGELVYRDTAYSANASDGSDLKTTGEFDPGAAGQSLAAYTPDGRVLRQAFGTDPRGSVHVVCAATDPGTPCERDLAVDPGRALFGAAASPDGRWVAAVATTGSGGGETSVIALYDAATGAHVRDLSGGPHDGDPTFSPDSSAVAFAGAQGISVVPVAGGTPTLAIPGGAAPTWAGPDDGTASAPPAGTPTAPTTTQPAPAVRTPAGAARRLAAALRANGLAALRAGHAVVLRFAAPRAGTLSVRLVLGKRKRTVASASHRFPHAATASLGLRSTAAQRRLLRSVRRPQLTVVVRFTPRHGRAAVGTAQLTAAA